MITKKITRAEVEAVLADGGNFTKVGLPVFAENFFEYGYQNISNRLYREEMEELLSNLEMNARATGDEFCGAVGRWLPTQSPTFREPPRRGYGVPLRNSAHGMPGESSQMTFPIFRTQTLAWMTATIQRLNFRGRHFLGTLRNVVTVSSAG